MKVKIVLFAYWIGYCISVPLLAFLAYRLDAVAGGFKGVIVGILASLFVSLIYPLLCLALMIYHPIRLAKIVTKRLYKKTSVRNVRRG